jgi:hypothetical protein
MIDDKLTESMTGFELAGGLTPKSENVSGRMSWRVGGQR